MVFYPDERTALLIDGSNLYSTIKLLDFEIDYTKFLELFKEKCRLITARYYTALLEKDDFSPIQPLVDWLDYNGYQVITKAAKEQIDRNGRKHIKGNIDIEIAVDALELAATVDHILLVTGDGDFRYLIEALQRRGVRVTVISSRKTEPSMLAPELRRQADAVIELADLDKIIGRPS